MAWAADRARGAASGTRRLYTISYTLWYVPGSAVLGSMLPPSRRCTCAPRPRIATSTLSPSESSAWPRADGNWSGLGAGRRPSIPKIHTPRAEKLSHTETRVAAAEPGAPGATGGGATSTRTSAWTSSKCEATLSAATPMVALSAAKGWPRFTSHTSALPIRVISCASTTREARPRSNSRSTGRDEAWSRLRKGMCSGRTPTSGARRASITTASSSAAKASTPLALG
mmetsp:Transcript_46622/g.105367  ORF Transcript_46622/g.105367 Transcript_46622/m.105367 type:complete len:227 (-) Transcript_46622:2150-2830(-)